MKYYRSNLLLKNAIGDFSPLQNLLQAFPKVSSFRLVNAAVILAFSLYLVLLRVLMNSLLTEPHTISRVRWSDIRSDVGAEIFPRLRLTSPACVAWPRDLFLDVGSSSSHPIDPGQYYLLQALYVGLHVEFEIMWERSPSLETTRNTEVWTVYVSSISLRLVGIEQANGFSVSSPSHPSRIFFSSEKNQSKFDWKEYLSWLKSFAERYFLLSFCHLWSVI